MADQKRIAVLISGSGSNLQALIDAQKTPALPDAQIVLVLSNRRAAYGLIRAAQASPPIPTQYLALKTYLKAHPDQTRDDYDKRIAEMLREVKPDLVVLAGWMHVFGEGFLNEMTATEIRQRLEVINLHPALPGQFDGANAIDRAFEAWTKGKITETGAMVHKVIKQVDQGEPIVVQKIAFKVGESKEDFEKRLHATEWQIIVEATRKVLKPIPVSP